jgi:polyhydroxyalkanoate synthesis regulator phasin
MPQPKQTSKAKKPAAGKKPSAADAGLVEAIETLREDMTRSFTLTAERIQESFEESVRNGRMTRSDAEKLASHLLEIARSQRQELLSDLERVLELSAAGLADAAREAGRRAREGVEATARTARRAPVADRALREVDRARRATGLASFPISNYDELIVSQVLPRLEALSPADLRKVLQYERSHANRKSVLGAIEKRLAA